ncbi:DUF6455 family protein [Thioclava sp. GXIMD2076]|uniref:DUF6455 family protein n=1 Tax=Thioclava kandeliae TaxID=3070818 RepID=A0ABV1SM66_9RHOB
MDDLKDNLHFWMLWGMARRAGVDLAGLLRSGRLGHARFEEMLAVCRRCRHACDCLGELSYLPAGQERPPAFCGNGHVLIFLHV